MIRLIARVTGDRALAEELAQDTFVKAFRNLAAFDTTRRLSSWLFRIAHNTAIDTMRRRPRLVAIEAHARGGANPEALAAPSAGEALERQALGKALERALAGLRQEYRSAVTLRYDEGLSFDEIGHILGVPEATARSHVHRARKELAARLTADGWRPGR